VGARKKSKVELTTRILYTPTGEYHAAGTVLELPISECERLIGLGVAKSTDGSVTAPEPEPEEPKREPVGEPRYFGPEAKEE
jgi:hypothetical protein